ncbi:MAG: hypothetical protein LQ343_007956 [Gyalolechia ehrenbergii]|nr:MAG: hypothetical protein LQ343_007956 [Gyalolechia ehrenbergii]
MAKGTESNSVAGETQSKKNRSGSPTARTEPIRGRDEEEENEDSDSGEEYEKDADGNIAMTEHGHYKAKRPRESEAVAPEATLDEHKRYYAENHVEDKVHEFFHFPNAKNRGKLQDANKKLENISKSKKANPLLGQIPVNTYTGHLNLVKQTLDALQQNPEDDAAWTAWKNTRRNISLANENAGLPETWSIPADYLEKRIGIRDKVIFGEEGEKGESEGEDEGQGESADESDGENEDDDTENEFDDSDDETDDDSLESLRKQVRKRYHIPTIGHVVAYKKCGSIGFQCLVKYDNESGEASTYRLLPSSEVGSWNRSKTPLLAEGQKGNLRDDEGKYLYKGLGYEQDGLSWVLDGIPWVAWQPKHRNPLDTIDPENWISNKHPPQVYCQVRWVKGEKKEYSIETRSTLRRLIGNKSQGEPDLVILRRAKKQEKQYQSLPKGTKKTEFGRTPSIKSRRSAYEPSPYIDRDTRSRNTSHFGFDDGSRGLSRENPRRNIARSVQRFTPSLSRYDQDFEIREVSRREQLFAGDGAKPLKRKKKSSLRQLDSAIGSDIENSTRKTSTSGKSASVRFRK